MGKQTIFTKDIVLILLASFFFLSSPMLVTPLITGFSESVSASAGTMGIIGGLMNLCALFCRPFVGNMADKFSKFKLSFTGAGLMAFACVGYIFATSPTVIVLARIINGVGYACCSVCMSIWMSNMLPKEKIGSGMGFYGMMNALGMAIAPAVGVNVYQAFGYRTAFLVAFAFSISATLITPFVSDKGESKRSPQDLPVKAKDKIQIVDRKVIPIAIIIMLFAIPYCATQSFLVSYVEARNLAVTVGLFFPSYAVVLLVLRFVMKSLFDQLPFRFFLFGGAASAFASLSFLGFMQSNFFMFLAAIFMAGGYGIMCSVCKSTAILLAGEDRRGLANSTYYIGIDLGMTLGPMIGGFLYGNVNLTLFYPILLIMVPLIILVYLFSKGKMEKVDSI